MTRALACLFSVITAKWLSDLTRLVAQEKVRLRKAGKPIEDFDLLIGCAAKVAGLTVVKHFSHIEGIKIEDWIK